MILGEIKMKKNLIAIILICFLCFSACMAYFTYSTKVNAVFKRDFAKTNNCQNCFAINQKLDVETDTIKDASYDDESFTNNYITPNSNNVSKFNMALNFKSAYLIDYNSGTVLFEKEPTKRLPIASMCKLMTLILCFEELDKGSFSLDDEIVISEKASNMGGSQVYLQAGKSYKIGELIKSIIVCSANDSCVAMAEKICGSDDLFVDKMNEKAKEMGLNNTLFANCTGLPKDTQYSCAKDVSVMLKTVTSHKEFFNYSKIWTDEFSHGDTHTLITNTNKLIRFFEGCDGGKTGFTGEAGFCLAATCKRGGMRLISVGIGANTSANRFEDIKEMFNYGFANYTNKIILDDNNPMQDKCKVGLGKIKEISAKAERCSYLFSKKGEDNSNIKIVVQYDNVKAPVKLNDKVGKVLIYKDNVLIDEVNLLSLENVERIGFFDSIVKIAENWGF